jgi:basic membrane protein A
MHRKKILSFIALLLLLTFLLGSCSPAATEEAPPPAVEEPEEPEEEEVVVEEEPYRVAYIPCGRINDGGFSQEGWDALQQASELYDLELAYTESPAVADVERIARTYAEEGYNMVFLYCGSFSDAASAAAVDFPDVWFGAYLLSELGENTFSIDGQSQETTFMAGVVAAMMTETKKLGVIAGFDFPGLTRQVEGFRLGARYINPDIETSVVYINSWEDVAAGYEAALAMIDNEVDIILTCTDQASEGIYKAAKENDLYAIGNYADQHDLSPGTILTSVVPDNTSLIMWMVELGVNGELEANIYQNKDKPFGKLAPFYELDSEVPQEVKDKLEEVRSAISDGSLVIPGTDVLGAPDSAATVDLESLEQ